MIVDFQTASAPLDYDADVCVIGAGAAGLALSLSLSRSKACKILVLESGGIEPSPSQDPLLEGETAGFEFAGLTAGRIRALGGTTRLWAGQCLRLDRHDMEKRPWVSNSGWPIEYNELLKYYTPSEHFLKLQGSYFGSEVWQTFGISAPQFDERYIIPRPTTFCPQPNLMRLYLKELRDSQRITVVVNATVTSLNGRPESGVITSVDIRTLERAHGRATARTFVLAAGGIENSRLLMEAYPDFPYGIGEAGDNVGLFLQEHPTARVAQVTSQNTKAVQRLFSIMHGRSGQKYWPKLSLSEQEQRSDEVLNCNIHPVYDYGEESVAAAIKRVLAVLKRRQARVVVSDEVLSRALDAPVSAKDAMRWFDLIDIAVAAPTIVREGLGLLIKGRAPALKPSKVWLQAQTEQVPDPSNRVSLSDERDVFGRRKVKIGWQVGELERRTFACVAAATRKEFQRLGLGLVTLEPWVLEKGASMRGQVKDVFHHIGTTRMAVSRREGVVDESCRVHGMKNLFVSGSSIFPTSGYANPTLTIIALALRLSDHIAGLKTETAELVKAASR